MADYQPIDLSRWCNAGVAVLGKDVEADVGRQSFRGLPFLVGAEGADPGDDPRPLGRRGPRPGGLRDQPPFPFPQR